jgi:hypothetical protein
VVSLQLFRFGDVYLDYPFEGMKFRFDKATGRVFTRFYGQPEVEIAQSDVHFREAVSAGTVITKDEYLSDESAE